MSETVASQVRWWADTDVGRVRRNNEDAFVGLTLDGREAHRLGKTGTAPLDSLDLVFAVADGMGGASAGDFASRIVVDHTIRLMQGTFRSGASGLPLDFRGILEQLADEIHRDLLELGRSYEECRGMGTTLTLAWLGPEWLYFVHVGDSRLYYLPKDPDTPIKPLTRDHSHVADLVRRGRITEDEARRHPRRNILTQALGGVTRHVEPQVGAVGLEPGDRYVLCTDGITEGHRDKAIQRLLRTPFGRLAEMNPAERLVHEAVVNSGRDNTTAIVLEVQ